MQDVQMQLWRYWAWLTQGFFGEPPYVPVIDPNPQPVVGPPPKSGSHQVRCFEPTWYQKFGIKAHQFVARRVNQPIGIGFGGTVSAGNIVGITASISHQMVVFPDGSGGLATTVAFPGLFNSAVSPGASAAVGVQLSTTNAASLRDLSGYSLDYGVTAGRSYGGAIDLALTQADARTVWQGTLTLGGAAGLVGHGGVVTLTAVQPFCGN